jgi:hypothetical protein
LTSPLSAKIFYIFPNGYGYGRTANPQPPTKTQGILISATPANRGANPSEPLVRPESDKMAWMSQNAEYLVDCLKMRQKLLAAKNLQYENEKTPTQGNAGV